MEGRGFGFVTFQDPAHAQSFLEVIDVAFWSTHVHAVAALMLLLQIVVQPVFWFCI